MELEQESAQSVVIESPETDATSGSQLDASPATLEPKPVPEPVSDTVSSESPVEIEAESIAEETAVTGAAAGALDQPASTAVESISESMPEPITEPTATTNSTPTQNIEVKAVVEPDNSLNDTPQLAATVPLNTASVNSNKAMQVELFVGASLMNFGYTEFAADDAWLDEENGVVPGLLVGGTLHWSKAYASLAMNYYFGEVEYQGQTQSDNPALSGLPISSVSDTDIFDTTVIAGYQFSSLNIYAGLGYYFWRRNIRPTVTSSGLPVAGVLEFYSWSYALLGAKTELWRNWTSQLELDLRVTRMLDANMEVDFLGFSGYDNATLNLGEDWGFRLAVPWTFQFVESESSIIIEPYYTSWNLKRSSVTELTVGGVATGSGVVEPRSETRNFGISIYFRYLM